jgi:hypothetical protein
MLDEILARLSKNLTQQQFEELEQEVNEILPDEVWYPNAGPQTDAYFSKADILLYGGQPGGGKSQILLGCAVTQHQRSLIVRKQFTDLDSIVDNLQGVLKTSQGIVRGNRPKYKSPDGRLVVFQGMGASGEIDSGKQGAAFDFIGVDEAAQLPENDVRMLIGWNRPGAGVSTNQRCRIILASNPPVNSTGDWLGTFFGPWLDPAYPKPAKFGDLRWFIFNSEGKSQEVDDNNVITIDGVDYYPHSRTYIPARLEDNPYLNPADYKKNLQTIPEPFRSQLLSGNFLAAREDQQNQVIPTAWVQAAIGRHEQRTTPPHGIPMCNMGVDCSGGGKDEAVIAPRFDHYFAKLIKFNTIKDEYGSQMAGEVIKARRDRSEITLDMGGGYGSGAYIILKENIGTEFLKSYRGGEGPTRRTEDGKLTFTNARSQAYWMMREALNPDQVGGSHIELPNDPKLIAGLTAPTFELRGIKIQVEPKDEVVKKLGYSPNEADAVVMAWWGGRKGLIPETLPRMNFNQMRPTKMADKYAERRGL